MSSEVKPSRRRYHSPLRADQARQTRSRILEGARSLFVERGYAGTTVAEVARLAGVSPETIYLTVGGKRGLLEGVIETAIAPEADASAQEVELWDELAHLSDARDRLRAMVGYSCDILARTSAVHTVIRGAADKEAFAAELGRRLLDDRLTNQTERLRRYLDADLADGLTPPEAGQRYCALVSPELYHLLTVELGWPPGRYRTWVTELLEAQLLKPA